MRTASGALGPDAGDVDGVVAEDDRVGPELAQLLDQVVDEGVVVVDDQDPGSHGPTMRTGADAERPPRRLANLSRRGNQDQVRSGRRLPEGQVGRRAHHVQGRPLHDGRGERPLHPADPQERRRSPPWFGAARARPAHRRAWPSSWSTTWPTCRSSSHGSAWGLVAAWSLIFVGFLLATRYR